MKVTYEIRHGRGIFEGDIDLGPVKAIARTVEELWTAQGLQPGAVVSSLSSRWPGGVVPYTVANYIPNQSRIAVAIDSIQRNVPGVHFVLRTTQSDYIDIVGTVDPNICGQSAVGKQGGFQDLLLRDDCGPGPLAHELLHALGFWHEQSRCDRDTYVQILLDSIIPNLAYNFDKKCSGATAVFSYDEGSIMHYPPNAFGIFVGNHYAKTIRSLRGLDNLMGQSSHLSATDAATADWMYRAAGPAITAVTYPGGVPTLTWTSLPNAIGYQIRVVDTYESLGPSGRVGPIDYFLSTQQTTGVTIQVPGWPYTGKTFCRWQGLSGSWSHHYQFEVIANYPYVKTLATRSLAAIASSNVPGALCF